MYHAINLPTISEAVAHAAMTEALRNNPDRESVTDDRGTVVFDKFGQNGYRASLFVDDQLVAFAIVSDSDAPATVEAEAE